MISQLLEKVFNTVNVGVALLSVCSVTDIVYCNLSLLLFEVSFLKNYKE